MTCAATTSRSRFRSPQVSPILDRCRLERTHPMRVHLILALCQCRVVAVYASIVVSRNVSVVWSIGCWVTRALAVPGKLSRFGRAIPFACVGGLYCRDLWARETCLPPRGDTWQSGAQGLLDCLEHVFRAERVTRCRASSPRRPGGAGKRPTPRSAGRLPGCGRSWACELGHDRGGR
jgi:hypothetical protein